MRTPLLTIAALIAALTLAACGSDQHQPVTHGESEGAYVKAGDLLYQVQMSRALNPHNVEDREYLEGLPSGTARPAADEEWFGVWLRVQNDTDDAQVAASDFRIVDTLGTEYEPIALLPSNPFSYQVRDVESKDGQPLLPDPESGAGSGPIQGALLLFKFSLDVYNNRPLELEIMPPDGGDPSTVKLDL